MSTQTVQFLLLLFICACILVLVWAWTRVRNAEVREHEELLANNRILREIGQIELHRPNHIIDNPNKEQSP